jgi:hypothetical protein
MSPTWQSVSDRYDARLAPPGLHLTQALVNDWLSATSTS